MTLVNRIPNFYAVETRTPNSPVAAKLNMGEDGAWGTIDMLGKLDPAKYKIKCVEGTNCTRYDIEAIVKETKIELKYFKTPKRDAAASIPLSAEFAILLSGPRIQFQRPREEGAKTDPAKAAADPEVQYSVLPADACRLLEGYVQQQKMDNAVDTKKFPTYELNLQIRSVGEIIQFLGDLVELQQAVPAGKGVNNPITLGYCSDVLDIGCNDILFTATSEESRARLRLTYRGRDYAIGEFADYTRPRLERLAPFKDHSIEVLAVLNQLIGLHRSADDVKPTPSVRLIP
jgi:hypothetical protein